MMTIKERIEKTRLVPVLVLDDAKDAEPAARALMQGGIDIIEFTLRTEAGLSAIEKVRERCPDMVNGAGTVLSVKQCRQAIERGAQFVVSPGFDPAIVDYCLDCGIDVFPGCVTPTEIMAALRKGLSVLKFFPADVFGGIAALKALSGPFPHVRYIPTGGVNLSNLAAFAAEPSVFAVGGGWLCDRKTIARGDFAAITKAASQSAALIRGQAEV